jgi:phage baseplate assembly protein gpV
VSLAALRSNLAGLAQMAADGRVSVRLGLVSSYDGRAGAHLVKVRLQPEDIETGWLPIQIMLGGQGWGVYAGPAKDDQAVVIFADGDVNAGICAGFLPSDVDAAPAVASGEIHLRAAGDTASIIAKPDGSIASKGAWTHTGTMHVTDEATFDKSVTATVDVVGGGKHLKTHVHSGVQSGGSNTGQPV